MAYLTADNVTVILGQEDIDRSGRVGYRTYPTVVYGNGVLQYPALGIPMPSLNKFGFHQALKRVYIEQPANGFIYHFDRTNHKLRIFLGAARDAITVANHTIADHQPAIPTGNVADHVGVAPTGNLANLAFAGDDLVPAIPTGNLANLVAAAHSHDLVVAANSQGAEDVSVGINAANVSLVGNIANATTIVGGNATTGGVANATPGNSSGDFVGDQPANLTPAGNVTGDFVGDAPANLAHVFTGDQPANLTHANLVHTVTGGGAVAEAALAEMDAGVAPAATTLYMEMIGT